MVLLVMTSLFMFAVHLERLPRGVDVEGGEVLGQGEVAELALHLLLALAHQHHAEGLCPGQVQLHLQQGEDELLSGGVQSGVFLDTPGLNQVVTKFGETKQNKIKFSTLSTLQREREQIVVYKKTLPFQKVACLIVEVEAGLGVLPLVAEDEHDPGVQLGQGGGHVALACLVENGADQPEIERVAGQGENVPVRLGSVL